MSEGVSESERETERERDRERGDRSQVTGERLIKPISFLLKLSSLRPEGSREPADLEPA